MNQTNCIEVEAGIKLHITGLGSGKPVILIHGWPENDEIFKFIYDPLVKLGYRAIGITMRGYGLSDRTPGK
jgi:pimeloyl-ACP methyl ester carboxylesterase